ncbi:MAG: hypothetical protein LBI34_03035 [Puniceicoccales bacterium]|jgi:uncharacterized protein involved in outer membrane biogenesis|nr:hypothetical protein [Puniceicoccales bacterium]
MKPINWVCNFIFGIIAFLLVVFATVAFSINLWLPRLAPFLVRNDSGFRLKIGQSESNVFTLNFNLYDVALENNGHYPVSKFVELKQFSTDLLLFSLFKKQITVEDFVLDLPQVTYVKNENGDVNVEEFLKSFSGKHRNSRARPKENGQEMDRELYFDHFLLHIGKVIMMDYTVDPVKVSEIRLDYTLEMENASSKLLVKKLTSDLRSRGALFLMQSVFNSINFPLNPGKINDVTGKLTEKVRGVADKVKPANR